jgi:hypothetical protein
MQGFFKKLTLIFFPIIIIGFIALSVSYFNLNQKLVKLDNDFRSSKKSQSTPTYQPTVQKEAGESGAVSEPSQADVEVNEELKNLRTYIDSALATVSGQKSETKVIYQQTEKTTQETSYISMGSTTTTTSMDWVDVPDSKVYIDLLNDFKEDAYVTFEASLKVAHANGQAFVRLFDETHGITVIGTELSTENNSSYKQVFSGRLALWRGNNLYKIQIKSLNSFEITYSGGKIKIVY